MLVTIAILGSSNANEPSDSSASVTNQGERPSHALVPSDPSIPPSTRLASTSPARSTAAIIAVVVVLPAFRRLRCRFDCATTRESISPRCKSGMLRRCAARYSGLCRSIAELTITVWARSRLAASCPIVTSAPSSRKRAVSAVSSRRSPKRTGRAQAESARSRSCRSRRCPQNARFLRLARLPRSRAILPHRKRIDPGENRRNRIDRARALAAARRSPRRWVA